VSESGEPSTEPGQLQFVAVEIGIFETLAQRTATLDELAQRIRIPRRTLRIVADAMVTLKLLERHGERYRNTPLTATFLAGASGPDFRPFLRFWNRVSYPRLMRFEEAVRTDTMVFGQVRFNEEEQRLYSDGVAAVTAGTASALAISYGFGRHRRLLDLGGGTGSFLLAILHRFSRLEGTLYDLPAVASLTRRRLAGTPYEERIQIIEGDFLKDSIPEGHDAILIANIVHCFPADQVVDLLRRVRQCVSPGARILLVDFWTNDAHTEPTFSALMAGEFLLTPGRGDVYSLEDAESWFAVTAFRTVEHKRLAGPASVLVAEAA
jgi:SAM-dependent methyltransferase